VVVDVDPPAAGSLSQLPRIRQVCSKTGILVAASELGDDMVTEALRLGASGFIAKAAAEEEFLKAVDAIRRGEIWLGRERLARALADLARSSRAADVAREPGLLDGGPAETLSTREHEIARLIAAGATNKEVGKALGTSDKTVKAHLRQIFAKLRINRRSQLARRLPFIEPSGAGWFGRFADSGPLGRSAGRSH
jgi:DNA-binding NarL/FixJ family response regulator